MNNFSKRVLAACLGRKPLAAALVFGLTCCSLAQASVVYDGSVDGKVTVTWDETFTMTAASTGLQASYLFLVVDNVFTVQNYDGFFSQLSAMSQSVSINGNAASTVSNWTGWQYRGGPEFTYNTLDAVFGLYVSSLPSFQIGDTLRWIGSLTANADSVFRMPDIASGSTTTEYLANYSGKYSTTGTTTVQTGTNVPEPASIALLGLGLAGISLIRRKRA